MPRCEESKMEEREGTGVFVFGSAGAYVGGGTLLNNSVAMHWEMTIGSVYATNSST